MREIIETTAAGSKLVGTLHRPDGESERTFEVGVILLSPGHVPRSGAGDLFPQLADELAARGLPVFRFDFPGLGDSFGSLPDWEHEYFRFVQTGGNLDYTQGIIAEMKTRFGLQGVFLGGLCGGAVTSIFTSAEARDDILGIVLMDPDFTTVAGSEAAGETGAAGPSDSPGRLARLRQKLLRPQTWMRFATGESRLRNVLRPVRSLLMPLARKLLGERLPSDTNFQLVDAFRRVVSHRVPTLVITARGMLREIYYEQVERILPARQAAECVHRVSIADTNHVFCAGGAKSTTIREVSDWISGRLANAP